MKKKTVSALSIRQPWAWFIVNGYKDVENRTWKPSAGRIGQRFMVHASKRRLTKAEFAEFLVKTRRFRIRKHPKSIDDFIYGAIVGSAVITKVVRGSKSFWAEKRNHHWILAKARRCKPRKRAGQLGFFQIK